jgi:chaperonin cofactor prefoldin
MEPKEFGKEYRDSIHFIDNPLEETEVIMRTLWDAVSSARSRYEGTVALNEVNRENIAKIEKFLEDSKRQSWWGRFQLSSEKKKLIADVAQKLEALRPDMAAAEAQLEDLKKDLESVKNLLATAEANWRKRLNS